MFVVLLVAAMAGGYALGSRAEPSPGLIAYSSGPSSIRIAAEEWCRRLEAEGIGDRNSDADQERARQLLLDVLHDEELRGLGFVSVYEAGYGWTDITEQAPC